MSLNLEQKQAVVAEVAKQVAGAQAIVMAENRGMPVADMTQLRAKARASGVYFRVVKNTLVRRAVADTPFAPLADKMVGPLAYGIGPDPVAVAKVLNDFAKDERPWVEALCEVIADNAALLAAGHDASFANKVHLALLAKGFLDKGDNGEK